MTTRLTAGDTAPAFSLQDANGKTVSLADYAGQQVIVYFYPKAMTPGCTTQACDFRDELERVTADGCAVLGISPDPVDKLEKLTEQEDLTFPMLREQEQPGAEPY